MKGVRTIVGIVVVLGVLASCASRPDTRPAEIVRPSFRIIEHKNSTLGGDIPDWTSMDIGELEADERFEGRYVFRFEETGRSLAGVRTVSDNMNAPAEVARLISMRVEQVFAGAQVGDQDFVETYFENVVLTLAQTDVSGLRKYGDFWVLKEYINQDGSAGRQEYAYYSIYTIERSIVAEQIRRAIDGLEAQTEEEQTARQRVRQIMERGL
ncbi:MAG: hypothetical protein EA382_03285 [Spirochaetaceae bacterium]|nr:MAG: hypothetical protein EA382_03285 [Spirochaetaceae bacterium]